MIDYHIHTKLCKHARGDLREYIEQAMRIGLEEISFTDHIPLPDDFDSAHRMTAPEMDHYVRSIEQARRDYPELSILMGIEADYYEGFEKYLQKFLENYDFDLVIMAVHFIPHWSAGNWVFQYSFPGKSMADIYREYLHEVVKGIKTGLFDIIGHIDIIKQDGPSLFKLIPDRVEDVLTLARKNNMAVEINSSGFRKKAAECYPGYDWLAEIRRLDLPLTLGSDAHAPEQVGFRFDEIREHLKEYDLDKTVRFQRRKMISPLRIT